MQQNIPAADSEASWAHHLRGADEVQVPRPGLWGFQDKAVEQLFRQWHIRESVRAGRIASWAAGAGWLMGLVGLWFLQSPQFPKAAALILGMPLPFIAVQLFLTRKSENALLLQRVAQLGNVTAGFVLVSLAALFELPSLAMAGSVITIYFGAVIFRLRPRRVLTAMLPFMLLEQALLWRAYQRGAVELPYAVVDTTALVTALITGLMASLLMERVARNSWRQQRIIEAQSASILQEKARADALLHDILPAPIVRQLRDEPGAIADRFDVATVLFADLVGFTPLASTLPPYEVVRLLNRLVSEFDRLSKRLGVEKIKTIGDAYMAVAGVPTPREDHALAAVNLALGMQEILVGLSEELGHSLELRIGVHTGPLVAGVIGEHKFVYDLWGDTVNIASRLESHGIPGRIQMSPETAALVRHELQLEERGEVEIKGKGLMTTWLVSDS